MKKTKIQLAVGDRVVVRPLQDEVTPGGIILPDNHRPENPLAAEVVDIGAGVPENICAILEEGDRVMVDAYGAFDMGDGTLCVRSENIVSIHGYTYGPDDDDDDDDTDVYCPRAAIFEEVDAEREYQTQKWGGAANDDQQTDLNWVNYIVEYAGGYNRAANYDFRKRMVKTAALAVAAIESYDRRLQAAEQAEDAGVAS